MEITWYGLSCFRLTERGLASVVTDPYDHEVVGFSALKLRAEIVTISHDAPGHNFTSGAKGYDHLITGPGEFEIGGVFITGVQTNGHKRNAEEPRNTLYVFEYEGVTVAHLGDLRRVPSQQEIEALGTVHVALVPVGGGGGLNASRAAERGRALAALQPHHDLQARPWPGPPRDPHRPPLALGCRRPAQLHGDERQEKDDQRQFHRSGPGRRVCGVGPGADPVFTVRQGCAPFCAAGPGLGGTGPEPQGAANLDPLRACTDHARAALADPARLGGRAYGTRSLATRCGA